jgi:hypothetical protein
MKKTDYKNFCTNTYMELFNKYYTPIFEAAIKHSNNGELQENKIFELDAISQKKAIMDTAVCAIRDYPEIEPALLWKAIYEAHVHRKSGIDDAAIIGNVISADQSWKKSSGHAFEEIIKSIGSSALKSQGISIVLQKDMSVLLKENFISNDVRDIDWLKEQINANIFDLYSIIEKNSKKYCFGCIQSKTSIRDRVTRDREPSINAMNAFFWSSIIVLDGDFLKNEKFINMVNGGSPEFKQNGWHGMYVFSKQYNNDRIYSTDMEMNNFKEHAIEAANYWLSQRQWFNHSWKATI